MTVKVILVHGFMGDIRKTWGGFPELLNSDTEIDCEIAQYGYSTSYWPLIGKDASIHNLAEGLLTEIRSRCDLENDEIILVGHSLGGLVIRKMLLNLHTKNVKHNIQKICFYAVPQDGSGLTNLPSMIAFRNSKLKALCKDSNYVEEINDLWSYAELNNQFDILSVVGGKDAVVNSNSSKSIFRDHPVETIIDAGHLNITKPKDSNDLSFILLRDFIQKKRSLIQYKNSASRELQDWLRIEDRNHRYQFVSDERRESDLAALVKAISEAQSVIRITGASGLGKSRLIIEAIHQSSDYDDNCILIYNAPKYEREIMESIRRAVDNDVYGLAVIENCSVDLHNELRKEVIKTKCSLRLITVGYSHEPVDDSIHIMTEPLSDDAIEEILKPILVNMVKHDVERVAKFAQGYPLLAVLMADQYKSEGKIVGSINIRSIVKKLIEGDTGITPQEQDILSACSLFDVFGMNEGRAKCEAKFIAEDVAHSTLSIFDKVIRDFGKKQIISKAGHFARLVPKPLALTLASDWWADTSIDTQAQLLDAIPETLLHSFCVQISYLDDQPNVQRFTKEVFALTGFFGQAEVLFTEKGSKLFRALTEVNPVATSMAIYRILSKLTYDQLNSIEGDIRRNLVWGLEKLCFRENVFEESSKSLLLLASAENENYSNNATGLFLQLFSA
ncbi:MAG TPA: hypothetical protein ENH23_00590, partial [candidate division Zixibacteria bacterium]|nr:hypothetical protein [candidate division Zixibacteria bacterium]